jgi:LruC domain-containing protein
LFPEVHKLFGKSSPVITNTYLKSPKYSSSTYTFSFGFSTPVSADQVVIDKMNFYSIVGEINSTDRHEIHMAGYNPSSKVKSATNSYKDENNMVWSIMVPVGSYKYPTEKSKISSKK